MIQQVMTASGVIEFREVETPEPGEGQVPIKVMRMGIYGPDIHVYHGEHPHASCPVTQGHEVSGETVKIGLGVEYLKEGQKVIIKPQMSCGQCYLCTHEKYNDCDNLKVMGFQTTGATSEYFAVDAPGIDVLPEGMPSDEGTMIEPLAVTIHAAKRYPDIQGANVCVLGCGPVGILVTQFCKALGAAKVMVMDVSDCRPEMAEAVGVDYAVNAREHDSGTALTDCFGSDKADVIYDRAGNDITMNQAIQNCRRSGTTILVAVFAGETHIDLAKLSDPELDLNTSFMYTHGDYVDTTRLVGERKIKLTSLMSKHFAFSEFTEAYRYTGDNWKQTMKVIIDIQN